LSQELWTSKEKLAGSPAPISSWFDNYKARYSRKGDWPFPSFSEFKEARLFSVTEFQLSHLSDMGCKFVRIAVGSKTPLYGTTWKKKSVNLTDILKWIRVKHGNVAVVSKRSGIFVVDVDPEPHLIDGEYRDINPFDRKHYSKLTQATKFWLPYVKETFSVKSPRGIHLWFKAMNRNGHAFDVSKGIAEKLQKLNVRADIFRKGNQYELIPPSVVTQEAIVLENERRKRLGQNPVNWKAGKYEYLNFDKPLLPLSKVNFRSVE